MADLREQLASALGERYAVQRELGRGGMAVVYVARDLRHDRDVAIKVLSPDLAASLGHERFLREIRVAARLSHPGIVPLHDSGDADGLLYYVMPVIEGESLAGRLRREGALPVEDALRIAAEVADALDYAGKQGVIHRDIKPGNILLSGGHALVADFGLAHALEQDHAVLTSSGLVVGTPMYMSPEQIGSSSRLDPRSDQYSLGCVLYEMLVGQPPFTGASVQQVFARHAVERVPSIRAVRDTVPELVEAAIHRAMAKNPADRFDSAGELARVLRGESFAYWSRASLTAPAPATRARPRWIAGGIAAAIVTLSLGAWWWSRRPRDLPLDAGRLAVLPFTSIAPDDSSASAIGMALSNLLAERFTGLGGPQAVDPAAVRAARPRGSSSGSVLAMRDVNRMAHALGAGSVLRGQVLSSGRSLSVTATIEASGNGAVLARIANVRGSADSLVPLADALARNLLVSLAGQPAERTAILQSASLPAVRSFLAGEREFARGQFTAARAHYEDALAQDSSLNLATIGWLMTTELVLATDSASRLMVAIARRQLPSMPPTDQKLARCLDSRITSEGEWDTTPAYIRCDVRTAAAPDRPDVWFQLGWVVNQQGWAGLPGVRDRAAASYRRALDIDPTYVPALGHLIEIEAARGDTTTVRQLGTRYLALDSTGDLADYYRWLIAASVGDTSALTVFRARLSAQSNTTLDRLISAAQLEGIRIDDAVAAAEELKRRAGSGSELYRAYQRLQELALNRGRPAEATRLARQIAAAMEPGIYQDFSMVFSALYWDGDTAYAAETVARLDSTLSGDIRLHNRPQLQEQISLCAVGLWNEAHDQWDRASERLDRLMLADLGPAGNTLSRVCALVLRANLEAARHGNNVARLVAQLDSPELLDPLENSWAMTLGNLALSRFYSGLGRADEALGAVQRRAPVAEAGFQRVQVALSTLYREEGRLARLAGRKEEARSAYGHYLALRANAEPSLRPEVDRIRAEVVALE